MTPEAADDMLQSLYNLTALTALPPHHEYAVDLGTLRTFWMACGIAYEHHDISLIEDASFDAIARHLGARCNWVADPGKEDLKAGTAQGWRDWPVEVHDMAAQLVRAFRRREDRVHEHDWCEECTNWMEPCTCWLDA